MKGGFECSCPYGYKGETCDRKCSIVKIYLYPQISTVYRVLLAKLHFFFWLVKLDQSSLLQLAMFNLLTKRFQFVIGRIYLEV